MRQLVDEQILGYQKFQMRHMPARLVQIRLGHHRVFAHDIQRPNAAFVCVAEDLGGGEAQLARETARLDVPGVLPLCGVVFIIHTHVAGIMERHGAHIAGALHVVLTAQRIQSRAFPPDMPGEKCQMDERKSRSSSVR